MVSALRLNALLDDLDQAGLDAGPSTRQQAHLVFMLLAEELSSDTPNAERRLIDHLRPLIIRGREQSQVFERVVAHWRRSTGQEDTDQGDGESGSREPETDTEISLEKKRFPAGLIWAAAAVFALVAGFVGLSLIPSNEIEPQTAIVTPNPTPAPSETTERATVDAPITAPEPTVAADFRGIDIQYTFNTNEAYLRFSHQMAARGFAPTLRELHTAGIFGQMEFSEVIRLSGFQADIPLPITEFVADRISTASLHEAEPNPNLWIEMDNDFFGDVDESWPIDVDARRLMVEDLRSYSTDYLEDFSVPELTVDNVTQAARSIRAYQAIEPLARPFQEIANLQISDGSVTPDELLTVDLSPDGTQFVSSDTNNRVTIWDVETRTRVDSIEGHEATVRSTFFSPNGRLIVSAGEDGRIFLWDLEADDHTEIFKVPEISEYVSIARFSNDGTKLVSGLTTGEIYVIDISNSGSSGFSILEGHLGEVWSVEFSPDDTKIISSSSDDTIRIWDIETETQDAEFSPHDDYINSASFSNDMTRIVTAGEDRVAKIIDPETGTVLQSLVGHQRFVTRAVFTADDQKIVTTSGDGRIRFWDANSGAMLDTLYMGDQWVNWVHINDQTGRVIGADDSGVIRIWEPQDAALWPSDENRIWTTEALANWIRNASEQSTGSPIADDLTNGDIVRQVAALSNHRGEVLRIMDPPWRRPDSAVPHRPNIVQLHAPWLAAFAFGFLGLFIWLWSAFNLRAYLQRRRPGDPGRVIELFSDTRHKADKVQNAIRRAAKALLQRQPGHERLDIKASVRATAKARGLFTPIEKRDTRMPEYLFLIDARSRADHETQRTLDYLERLRKEHVPITHYFYERAPDRVRASMGAPAQSLDLIASEHSDKRLVLVGDAAAMYASNRSGSGGWKKTLESWQSKSFVTTVPAAEWGVEEEKFTQETGLVANVLSAEGLEALPTALFAEGMVGQTPLHPAGALDVPPLPGLLRRDPERWIVDSAPDDDEWLQLQTALVGYLSISGWRWLSACAVYPVVEWDLTVALGQMLKEPNGDLVFTESLAARLSELPWMRAGEMPDWLRGKLIEGIEEDDREAVRDLIAKILEAVDSERKTDGDTISLKFGYLQGREPDSDERFVDFVTRAPESMDENALLATRKLRELLRPNIWSRLIDPGALGWLVIGLLAAGIAWLVAPRYLGTPSHTGSWTPLLTMLLGPLLAWGLWRGGKGLWNARPRQVALPQIQPSEWAQKAFIWTVTFFGLTRRVAEQSHLDQSSDRAAIQGPARLLRRRVEVWAMVPMVMLGILAGTFAFNVLKSIWYFIYFANDNWISAIRTTFLGDLLMTTLVGAAVFLLARAIWWILPFMHRLTVRLADRATLTRRDLLSQKGGRLSRAVFIAATVIATYLLSAWLLFYVISPPGLSVLSSETFLFSVTALCACVIAVCVVAWHWWTLRRFASNLNDLDQVEPTMTATQKVAA